MNFIKLPVEAFILYYQMLLFETLHNISKLNLHICKHDQHNSATRVTVSDSYLQVLM